MAQGNKFEFKEVIRHPRELVYTVMRDRMAEMIPLLPNVESVKVAERKEVGPGRIKIINQWQGKPTSAPKVVQPFITPEMSQWTDHAEWVDAEYAVNWRFEMANVGNYFSCEGTNFFEVSGHGTLIRLTGTLTLYPERVPGVPKFLARSIATPLEKLVLGIVSPNLTELPAAVGRFLDQQK